MAPRKREAGLTHVELLLESLRGLKETFERERREARKAGSAGFEVRPTGRAATPHSGVRG
jgi:hypothetical protein